MKQRDTVSSIKSGRQSLIENDDIEDPLAKLISESNC
jgi:hypothetical protein